MAGRLPDGATLALATAYGADKTMSALTNADPAVATLEGGHGIATGEFFEMSSGWSRLHERVFKAGTVATNDVPVLGQNTTDTSKYPPGSGTGTVREITTFTDVAGVLGFTTEGGEPSQVTYAFLEEDFERSLSGPSSAQRLTITLADGHHAAGYNALKDASEEDSLVCLKLTLKNGDVILYNGKVHLNETPSVNKGQVMAVTATFNLQAKPVRYNA